MSDSAHAAGLPRNANTSCTHTPCPRVHRDLPCRRRRTFTFPGRCRIARLRNTRTEIPAAHNQSGTPRIARIAQIIVTPSRSHRLPQPKHRRAAGDIPNRQGVQSHLPNADSTRHPAGMTIGILQRSRELTRMRRRHPDHPGRRHLRQSRRGGRRLRPSHGREEERRVRPHRGCRDHQGRRRQGRGRAPRQHCEASRLGRCARRRCAVRDRATPRAHRARSSVVAPAQPVLRVPVASRVTSGTTSRRRPPAR